MAKKKYDYRKCNKGELPKAGHIYFIGLYTAPKVFNGLYFECLLTDQKIPAYAKLIEDLGHIHDCETEIWKPERFGRVQFAAPPPASEGEMEEVIWGEPLRNSYNKGFLDSKKEQIMDFIKWFGEQDLKRYAEGWCQPGGSNGFHYSDDDLYKLFCNRENVATLPTREPEAKEDEPKYPIDHFS